MLGRLNMTDEERIFLYEWVQTMLGGEEVDVDITEKELLVLAQKALRAYLFELNTYRIRNMYPNVAGTETGDVDFTCRFVFDNTLLAQRISDWFASLARVGGSIPWKMDSVELVANKQVYNLATDSSQPFEPNSRKYHRIMWIDRPVMSGASNYSESLINANLFNFGQAGLGNSAYSVSYLGNTFDTVLLGQAYEERRKVYFSEFFYNISGDILEITPGPDATFGPSAGQKFWYYYMDKVDFVQLTPHDQEDCNRFILHPAGVEMNEVDYSLLNSTAKTWIDDYTFALAKYVQASKWRVVRNIASPGSDYQVEFDYQSLLEEAKTEMEQLKESLREELSKLDKKQMLADQAEMVENSSEINKKSPRKMFWG